MFLSQPATKWELVDLFGTWIHTFDTSESMQDSWGDVFKGPIDDDFEGGGDKQSNEQSPSTLTFDGINSETITDQSNNPSPSKMGKATSNASTVGDDFKSPIDEDSGVEGGKSNENSSSDIVQKEMSGAATAAVTHKKPKVFDEVAFLGPRIYMPRMRKTQDPYLHCDGYLYRKTSPTRYLCNRWMHPLLDNEWLTQNQSSDMVNYLNKNNNNGKKYINVTCPAVLEIDRETKSATITTNHTCDMPHCKTPVAIRANLPNDAVEFDLDPVNDFDNK
jgi:hypothetical protein